MPKEQPLAQDLMQEALSSNGSQVEQFLSPTIFPGQQQASTLLGAWGHRYGDQWSGLTIKEEECECAFKFSHFPFTAQSR